MLQNLSIQKQNLTKAIWCKLISDIKLYNYGSTILKNDLYYIKISLKKDTGIRSNIILTHGLKPSDTLSTVYLKHLINKLTQPKNDEIEALLMKHDFYIFVFINTDGVVFGNSVTNIAGSNLYEMGKNSRFMQKEMHVVLKQINRIQNIFLLINLSVDYSRYIKK